MNLLENHTPTGKKPLAGIHFLSHLPAHSIRWLGFILLQTDWQSKSGFRFMRYPRFRGFRFMRNLRFRKGSFSRKRWLAMTLRKWVSNLHPMKTNPSIWEKNRLPHSINILDENSSFGRTSPFSFKGVNYHLFIFIRTQELNPKMVSEFWDV